MAIELKVEGATKIIRMQANLIFFNKFCFKILLN